MDDDDSQTGDCEAQDSDDSFHSNIHDFHQLIKTNDREGLASALDSAELYQMACDDVRYLDLAMLGIAVLAWDAPAQASELLVRFDVGKAREDIDSSARLTARAMLAALEWRHLEQHEEARQNGDVCIGDMDALRAVLRQLPVLESIGAIEESQLLREDMHKRPAIYGELFATLASDTQALPRWILGLVNDGERTVSEAQFAAMERAVAELKSTLRRPLLQGLVSLVGIGLAIALPNLTGALLVLVLVGGYMGLGEIGAYTKTVRPRLVSLAIEHGVGCHDLVSFLYTSKGLGRVGSFDIKISSDVGLELLAALVRRLPKPPE